MWREYHGSLIGWEKGGYGGGRCVEIWCCGSARVDALSQRGGGGDPNIADDC